jgi:hypothetical protein
MGPFHLPWSTFSAFLVVAAAVLVAVFWAIDDRRREKGDGR